MNNPKPRSWTSRPLVTAAFLMAVTAAVTLGMTAPAQPSQTAATITVVFAADDQGFNVTSSKDISNIIVVLCGPPVINLKLEAEFAGSVKFFNHTEAQVILGVYVKSGNNGILNNIPPGAGEWFPNAGAGCSPTTATTTPPTTSPSANTTGPSTTTSPTASPSANTTVPFTTTSPTTNTTVASTTTSPTTNTTSVATTPPTHPTAPPPSTEIPFFPSTTAFALATVGALGGAFAMMRRRN